MVDGIILAGGFSSRVGKNKMILKFLNKPLIYHTVKSMSNVCKSIIIVTGKYQEDYQTILKEFKNIKIVHNELYEQGMFSSVLKGIDNTNNDIFLIPGDYPLVKEFTYKLILQSNGEIRVPTFSGRRGHPIFISKELIPLLKQEGIASNLKVFRDKFEVNYIEVEDQGILLDIDSLTDYEKLLKNHERND
ncbi:NTP transferase domain-containing protein [Candidatus Izimaplasma bacterium ZiA1]|uniref:nucleotidyltransferase family protein n=1 Tax=Candidatus Izimoplasma sp. ZiA1 TaxID=2024899 RepID=UPI001439F3B0